MPHDLAGMSAGGGSFTTNNGPPITPVLRENPCVCFCLLCYHHLLSGPIYHTFAVYMLVSPGITQEIRSTPELSFSLPIFLI